MAMNAGSSEEGAEMAGGKSESLTAFGAHLDLAGGTLVVTGDFSAAEVQAETVDVGWSRHSCHQR